MPKRKAKVEPEPCWNCGGSGKGLVFDIRRPHLPNDVFKPGPCVVCGGTGRVTDDDEIRKGFARVERAERKLTGFRKLRAALES
jgi:hypothetical protein